MFREYRYARPNTGADPALVKFNIFAQRVPFYDNIAPVFLIGPFAAFILAFPRRRKNYCVIFDAFTRNAPYHYPCVGTLIMTPSGIDVGMSRAGGSCIINLATIDIIYSEISEMH